MKSVSQNMDKAAYTLLCFYTYFGFKIKTSVQYYYSLQTLYPQARGPASKNYESIITTALRYISFNYRVEFRGHFVTQK